MGRTSVAVDQDVFGTVYSIEHRISDGTVLLEGSEPNLRYQLEENRSTVNTPGFRTLRRRSGGGLEGLPMNPFSYTLKEINHPVGRLVYHWPERDLHGFKTGTIPVNPLNLAPNLSLIDRDGVNSRAINKSLNDLKNMKVNLGVAFATRKQTYALVGNAASRIASALSLLKAGKFAQAAQRLGLNKPPKRPTSKGKRLSDSLSSDWLSLQYGWLPLLNDVYGSVETLALQAEKPLRLKVTASETDRWTSSLSPGTFWDVTVQRREKGQYTRKYVYVFSYSHTGLNDLAQVGITNPGSILWEVLPWSFVVDWFIPIGEYIDAWDATLGVNFEKGSVTTFEKSEVKVYANGTVQAFGGSTNLEFSSSRLDVRCVREPLTGFPAPSLPRLDPGFGWRRAANSLALIFQRLRR